jgi:hypothetical protein
MSISFGVFLFVLFFQPFALDKFEFNDRLIFTAGLGVTAFLFMMLVRILFSMFILHKGITEAYQTLILLLRGFSLFTLSSVAFAFYLRYVGGVRITFYVMLKVLLICLAAPVVIRIYDIINNLKFINDILVQEKKILLKQVEHFEEDYFGKTIEFVSENCTDALKLQVADVVYIRSADNYVEIVYQDTDSYKKKLIRNTMKSIEQQIKSFSNFIRCHRICIVNTHFIEKLYKSQDNYWICLKGYDEKIPVSRQYLLRIKEMI